MVDSADVGICLESGCKHLLYTVDYTLFRYIYVLILAETRLDTVSGTATGGRLPKFRSLQI